MRVAVMSLCRDRLDYTKACFAALRENADCDYDHYVLDQDSADGTSDWLTGEFNSGRLSGVIGLDHNAGIHRGMNKLLDHVANMRYDLLVKIDNDCQIVTPGTLKAVAEHVLEAPEQPRVVSPLILGLRKRPPIHTVRETPQGPLALTRALGGVFMPIPPSFVKAGFRYDENAPLWGGDDERISAMAHEAGGTTGYLLQYQAWHYRSTDGQHEDYPEYFRRRQAENGPA